jgi:hypothetical protein
MVRPHEGIEHRVVASAMEKEAVVQDALSQCVGAFGDPLACDVLDGRDDFEAEKIGLSKREVDELSNGSGGDAMSCLGRSDPVAEIGDVVIPFDLVEAAPP